MLRTALLVVVLAVFCSLSATATDYVYMSANGDTSAAGMTSGDTLAFGCNVNGRGVWWEVFVDIDQSGDISPGDKFLVGMPQIDQDFTFNFGMPDGDTMTGWVRMDVGPAGLTPGWTYIVRATDEDGSFASDTGYVLPLPQPDVIISGTVSLEGVTPPDSSLAMIEVEASPETMVGGFWTAFTDTNGDYTIELDSSALGEQYEIGPLGDIFAYVRPDGDTVTLLDTLTNMDYTYQLASAKVVGSVVDDLGDSLPRGLGIAASDTTWETKEARLHEPGRYFICFSDSELGDWNLGFWGFGLLPYYIIPPERDITLNPGDSLVEDFIVYRADTIIVGKVTIVDTVPLDTFHFMIAECETSGVGMAMTLCDSATGLYELGVNSADTLTWRVAIDPPFGDRIPGHVVEGGFVRSGFSGGDTVNFNFVPATDTIGGTISFHPSVPGSLQFPLNTLTVLLSYWHTPFFPPRNASGMVNPDPSGVYWFPSEPDTYGIFITNLPDTLYYSIPFYYDSLIINGGTDTLDFLVYHSSVGVQEEVMGKSRFGGPKLYACSPNPFVGRTVIEAYSPPEGEYKSSQVSVYDVTGRLVKVLSKGEHGSLRLHWDGKSSQGRDVSAGIFFVRLEASGVSITRKAVLLR